jgi:hypothetical protein
VRGVGGPVDLSDLDDEHRGQGRRHSVRRAQLAEVLIVIAECVPDGDEDEDAEGRPGIPVWRGGRLSIATLDEDRNSRMCRSR